MVATPHDAGPLAPMGRAKPITNLACNIGVSLYTKIFFSDHIFSSKILLMQKYWGIFREYWNKYSKHISLAIIAIFVCGFFVIKPGETTTANKVKGQSKVSEAKIQKEITENKEKYYPKYDWLTAHAQTLPTSSKASIILDYNTREVLFADNEHEKLPPASITKVLTAIVVLENMKTDKLCTISQTAADTEPNKITMKTGEKLKVEDLLYGLMMISANDAAEALAECYDGGRDAFIEKMNERAKLIGLTDTHFVNPNGLHDDNHYTSAFDMATITYYAIKSNSDFLKYMGHKEDYSVFATEHNEPHWWQQISNLLQTYPGMDGAKTGFTYEAGNTYIGTAERNGRRIIIVYLNANSTTYDAKLLLDQGFYLSPGE